MILVPLPRFVLPTARPLFCRNEGPVDESFADVDLAAFVKVLDQFLGSASENTLFDPLLEVPVAGLVRRVSLG
jgi:hypothetical protein